MAHEKLHERKFTEPARGQLSGSLDKELHHSDASVLVYSKWKMSLTRAAPFTWLSPSQD